MRVPAVFMRGGTSKALFFLEQDLPPRGPARDAFLLAAFGSPDPYRTQLDGMGGGTSSTSKVAIIGGGAPHGVDVTFEFGQVGIDQPSIDLAGTCGNISSAVGPYAVDEGLVTATGGQTSVRFLNLNTGKVVRSTFATRDGRFDPVGEFAVPGVPGTGSVVQLDFLDPGGAVTGRLLPTGHVTDEILLPGAGRFEVSIVDAANPVVFVSWDAVGLTGSESYADIAGDARLLALLEDIRAAGSVMAGIAGTTEQATRQVPAVPKIALVAGPRDYRLSDGGRSAAADISVRAAAVSMGQIHRSYPLTAAIATTVASSIPGTLVNKVTELVAGECVIGHTSGAISMSATVNEVDGAWRAEKVTALRTARRLMEGTVLVP